MSRQWRVRADTPGGKLSTSDRKYEALVTSHLTRWRGGSQRHRDWTQGDQWSSVGVEQVTVRRDRRQVVSNMFKFIDFKFNMVSGDEKRIF